MSKEYNIEDCCFDNNGMTGYAESKEKIINCFNKHSLGVFTRSVFGYGQLSMNEKIKELEAQKTELFCDWTSQRSKIEELKQQLEKAEEVIKKAASRKCGPFVDSAVDEYLYAHKAKEQGA